MTQRAGDDVRMADRLAYRSSWVRTDCALLVGVGVAVVTGVCGSWSYAALAGWDAAAATFVVWVWTSAIGVMSAAETASHATREDPGKRASDLVVLGAAVASLVAVALVLGRAASAKGSTQDLLAGFGLASVALSWFAVHTLFTLRYTHLYYTGPDGGVDFNQDEPPRYLDFAYLAFTLGMTFQVSDTDLKTTAIRATAFRHALLSFLFGSVILATTVNLIAGLGAGGGGG